MENLVEDTCVFSSGNEIVTNGIVENHNCFNGSSNVNLNYGNKQMFREVVIPQPLQIVQQTVGHEENIPLANVWKEKEVALLMATYNIYKDKFSVGTLTNKKVWILISNKVHGVIKDHMKCDEKWRNLKKTYDKVRMENGKLGNGNVLWKYFEDFEEIYLKDTRFHPNCTSSSSDLIKRPSGNNENEPVFLLKIWMKECKEDMKKRWS